jgi:outer membrane biosynthesis protein TonB
MQHFSIPARAFLIAINFWSQAMWSSANSPTDNQSALETEDSDCSTDGIHQVRPDYPKKARLEKVTGEVELKAVISNDGKLRDISPLSGHPLLSVNS